MLRTIPSLSRRMAVILNVLVAMLCGRFVVLADENTSPIPLIFDTDIGNDVDDVLALGMIHALQSRGECELLAVTITKDHPLAAAFTDAVNTFYGRGEIPIGICQSGITNQAGKFIGLANEKDDGTYRYPHDLLSGRDAPQAVDVLRKTLAGAADGSVVIVQVGFSTNLADLLDSPADQHSPLTGIDLVTKKVHLLSVMAGAFEQIRGTSGDLYDHKEYNIVKDVPAAQKLALKWPTEIIYSGYEIGISVAYPAASILRDYRYVQHHPLSEAYTLYNPPPHNRPTWDLTSVLIAIRPDRGYFDLSPPGTVTVAEDGLTTFQPGSSGSHRYLELTGEQPVRVVEAMLQLSSQPPCR